MNNSKIAIDNVSLELEEKTADRKPMLRQREGELAKIIEAIGAVEQSHDWQTLKSYVFDGVVESLERRLNAEVKKKERDNAEIDRLNGQLQWANKFSNLTKLADIFKVELKNVRTQLK